MGTTYLAEMAFAIAQDASVFALQITDTMLFIARLQATKAYGMRFAHSGACKTFEQKLGREEVLGPGFLEPWRPRRWPHIAASHGALSCRGAQLVRRGYSSARRHLFVLCGLE